MVISHHALWFSFVAAVWAAPAAAKTPATGAAEIVRGSGAPGGICAVVDAPGADWPVALSKRGRFVVHCLQRDVAGCDRLRTALRARGEYGPVTAAARPGTGLPYTNNLVNILVVFTGAAAPADGLSVAEMLRALAPLGTGYVGGFPPSSRRPAWLDRLTAKLRAAGIKDTSVVEAGGTWVRFRKPWPEDIDEWTHYLHGADGNPVARDRVVAPPNHYQWTAGPTWMRSHESDSSVSTLVTARGRLFYIVDEAPTSLVGNHPLPDKWFLAARDAFNGVALWKVPIRRWGWREWKSSWFNTRPGDVPLNIQKRLVAVGEKVYVTLGYHAPVSQLDARTGEILRTYDATNPTGEILHVGGTLVLSVLDGEKVRVTAVESDTGKRLWTTKAAYAGTTVDYIRWRAMRGATKPAKLDPSLNLAADAHTVALIDGAHVVGLDFATGKQRWRRAFPLDEADARAGGVRSGGKLWIGTMIVRDGVVVHASPNRLAGIDAETGKVLWTRPKKYIGHLWYEWKDVFVIDGLVWTWTADLQREKLARSPRRPQASLFPHKVIGYDLRTGEPKREVLLGVIFKTHHHHRCYRNKATSRYILASRRGSEYVDLLGGRHTVHNWVRGTCHVGMMPANGLQYAPPHPCVCYLDEKLNGLMALAPANAWKPPAWPGERLRRGGAFGQASGPPAGDEDWPAFRHDAMRTGSTRTRVPDGLEVLWRVRAGLAASAPTAAGGKVFVALGDEDHVACLDAATGRQLWEAPAGGRVDSPPTYRRGTVLFGSADGTVTCLRANDGRLVWQFAAAPAQRLLAAGGRIESAWPVHGSVLVVGDAVYFAAGRTSQLDGGIHLYALGADDGRILHQTLLAGPDYVLDPNGQLVADARRTSDAMRPAGPFPENYDLPMGALPDVLMSDGNSIVMRRETFGMELSRRRGGRAKLVPKAGFLDGNYFKRTPWTFAGKDYARLIVHDRRRVFFVRMFDSLAGLDPSVYFTPGRKGYLLFAKDVGGRKNRWSGRIPARIRAMVLAGERLYVAGPPDVVDDDDPLGAFEGRKGGRLYVFDAVSGKQLAEHNLPQPPVFNGMAAAERRLLLVDESGFVTAFGKE